MHSTFIQVIWGICALSSSTVGHPASPRFEEYKVFEKINELPEGWREVPARIDVERSLSLRIHLAQQNVERFEQKVIEISTPDHSTYGDHMGHQDIKDMLRPADETVENVLAWLDTFGLSEKAIVEDDWVKVDATIGKAQELLHTEYSFYRGDDSEKTILRTTEYSLPAELHKDILLIQPTTMFGLRAMKSHIRKIEEFAEFRALGTERVAHASTLNVTACDATITPACLRALYNFEGYTPSATSGNKLGVNGFLEQYAQYADLETFLAKYRPEAQGANFTFVSVNGGLNTQDPTTSKTYAEANLDIQYTVGVSYPIPNIYFSTPSRPPHIPDLDAVENDSEPYLDWLNWLLKQDDIPQTITTSYGESEQIVPLSYRKSVCNLFAQLGARGVSVLFSSGDSGPGWSCLSNDGKNTTKFLPTFPAACPFVTSVGGTIQVKPEKAVYFSSGGFSETWDMPDYQKDAVNAFYMNHPNSWKPWAKYFVKGGRGFPDVSAQGDNYHVILGGRDYLIGGTSASSPAFAGIVSLLNDDRLKRGKKPLGFLNPWLYSRAVASTFTDIKAGRSTGCNAGWDAVEGWDPVTGLGTPNFDALRRTY
ncbi:subtilisin-like protein [Choiromyces venosus 120613-1]|uniref:tripeptidyl-peptidase II n=1 Tax=Choiromyces venosus 120613-1 TaxID=1336337 RepID=A0A3N4JTT6_9PEZI|nr:subtilisin-like protein [Choiromyces venosus 120613-1]